ncbi:MAG: helix-turn-helix transcriptional regulator [Phycisphaerales bacterium]|nr:MAG: helix-turn-helix transcriptional regulator [Phycisphaerales bacterium]
MAKRDKVYVMRQAEQLAALSTPIRWQIVETLSVHGPSSVRQLAEHLDRKPEPLYYHVRALLSVGLVLVDSKRKANRRAEAVYRLVASHVMVDRKQRSRAYREALCRSCESFLRLAAREHRAAVERGDLAGEADLRSLMIRRHTGHLTRDGLRRLNRLLAQMEELLDKSESVRSSETYALTVVLTPLPANQTQ